jgi:hypothetical protein
VSLPYYALLRRVADLGEAGDLEGLAKVLLHPQPDGQSTAAHIGLAVCQHAVELHTRRVIAAKLDDDAAAFGVGDEGEPMEPPERSKLEVLEPEMVAEAHETFGSVRQYQVTCMVAGCGVNVFCPAGRARELTGAPCEVCGAAAWHVNPTLPATDEQTFCRVCQEVIAVGHVSHVDFATGAERHADCLLKPAPEPGSKEERLERVRARGVGKPFTARHRGDNPSCEVCMKPVEAGDKAVRVGNGSRRAHAGCVELEW